MNKTYMLLLFIILFLIVLSYLIFSKQHEHFINHNNHINNLNHDNNINDSINKKQKIISFCITCMNRLWQLKQTLPKNLKENKKYSDKIEFVLVNFVKDKEGEEIDNYVRNTFKNEIKSGYLNYYVTKELKSWNASIAKNTSHNYATGKLLYNLDCDNFVINKEVEQILESYRNNDNYLYFGWSDTWKDGTAGRVCTTNKQFREVNGYNQYFEGTGYEDLDLLRRVKSKYNLTIEKPKGFVNKAIQNDKDEGIQNIDNSKKWKTMERNNAKTSKKNIKNKIYKNNHSLGLVAFKVE